jgi:hypothetical protein
MSFLHDRALAVTGYPIEVGSYDLAEVARPSYAELAAGDGIPVASVTNLLRERLDRP